MKLKIFISTFLFMMFLGVSYLKYEELNTLKKESVPVSAFSEMGRIKKIIKFSELGLKNEKIFSSRINKNSLQNNIENSIKNLGDRYNFRNFKIDFLRDKSYEFLAIENLEKSNFLRTQVSFESPAEKDIYNFLDETKKICGIISIESIRIKNLKVLMILKWNFLLNEAKNFISIKKLQREYFKNLTRQELSNEQIYLFSHRPQYSLLCILNNSAYIVTTSISDHKILEKKWKRENEFIGEYKIEKINTKTITITTNNKCRRIKLGEQWF